MDSSVTSYILEMRQTVSRGPTSWTMVLVPKLVRHFSTTEGPTPAGGVDGVGTDGLN